MTVKSKRCGLVLVLLPALLLTCGRLGAQAQEKSATPLKIFSGQPRLIVVNGYSTSFRWPRILQRKIDQHSGGKRVIEVRPATRGGSPIAKWIDVKSGRPLSPWQQTLRPALKQKGDRPAIVLAQQSLQWAFGERRAGIRDSQDTARIKQGADVLQRYAGLLLADGADEVFIAMHIYKEPMEPEIGNERLALAEFLKTKPAHVHGGPDVWEPTRQHYPQAFADDKVHPNSIGAEIIAQLWFEALLRHDGLEVPKWSRDEMDRAIKGEAVAQSRQTQRGRLPQRGPAGGRGPGFQRIKQRFDANKDGRVTKEEWTGPERMFQRLDKNKDGALTKDDFDKPAKSSGNQPGPPQASGTAAKTDLGELAAKLFPNHRRHNRPDKYGGKGGNRSRGLSP